MAAKAQSVSPGRPDQAPVEAAEAGKAKAGAELLDPIKALLGAGKTNKAVALEKQELGAKLPLAKEDKKADEAGMGAAALLASLKGTKNMKVEAKASSSDEAGAKVEGPGGKEGKGAAPPDGRDLKLNLTDLRLAHKAKPESDASATAGQARPGQDKPLREVSLDLDPSRGLGSGRLGDGVGQAPDTSFSANQAAPARDFTSVLTEQLKATWNGDIVQNAHLILKDGDAGTIRLRLHPDSLGGVKIELQLADKSISGKIIVESDEAKTAFERNMASLQDAFKQGGFESARLEVQVGSGNSGAAGGQGQDGPVPFWSERRGLDSLAVAVPEVGQESRRAKARGGVDLLA